MIIQSYKSWLRLGQIQNRQKTQSAGRQNTSFPKELVENKDLYKPVLNKITITQE